MNKGYEKGIGVTAELSFRLLEMGLSEEDEAGFMQAVQDWVTFVETGEEPTWMKDTLN